MTDFICRRLAGKAAIVTGAGAGIGLAIARRLTQEGARVLLAEIDPARGQTAAAALQQEGADAVFLATDVTRPDDVRAAVEATAARFGSLDIVVNNAGNALRKPAVEHTDADWQRMIDLNLTSQFLSARAAYPFLKASGGAIVNVASMHAFFTVRGVSAYAAAKGGVVALTHSLALEFAPNIRVNAVVPGLIETDNWLDAIAHSESIREARRAIHPLGRIGRPEDVASAAAFLASADAAFLTGVALPVDGGLTLQLYRE